MDEHHRKYVDALRALYDAHKEQYAPRAAAEPRHSAVISLRCAPPRRPRLHRPGFRRRSLHVEGMVVCKTAEVLRAPILGGQGKRMPRMQMTFVMARPGGAAGQVLLSQFKGCATFLEGIHEVGNH